MLKIELYGKNKYFPIINYENKCQHKKNIYVFKL